MTNLLIVASGGYYGLCTSTPPQCVEIFSLTLYRGQGIVGRLFKFAGYIHNHKILPGNIFSLILENKIAATGVFQFSERSFVGPLEQRVLWVEISNLQDMFLIMKY